MRPTVTPFRALFTLAALALSAPAAVAQGLPRILVTDTGADALYLCTDVDQDGTYDGSGEITIFYDDVSGPIQLTNNTSLLRLLDGSYAVTDSTEDIVLRLVDLDGNGDAFGNGEATIFFDGTAGNPSGVELTSARNLWQDPDGTLWIASANVVSGGIDSIVWLRDVNGDGDANDTGEQGVYYAIGVGGATGDSIPTGIVRGPDGALYYSENGATGVFPRGVYRLEDLNGSGDIDSPAEVTLFFETPPQAGNSFHWHLGIDTQGRFILNDTGNDLLWRLSDLDGDGTVDPATEAEIIFVAGGASLIWATTPAADGSLWFAEDQTPDRIQRLVDLDGDGLFLGANELQTLYDETTATFALDSPKALVFVDVDADLGLAECSPAVPNSTGAPGEMRVIGSTSVNQNNVLLRAESVPPFQFGIFVVSRDGGTMPIPGSQGILCLTGTIGRYPNILNAGAAGAFELPIDLTLIPQGSSIASAAPGDVWRFQAWHRDLVPTTTSNFTDARAVTFTP